MAKDIASNDDSASFQLTSAMNRFRRDFLAAYISASSDPSTYGKITVLTIPGQVNGPKLANNAITTDTAVSQDLGVIGRDNQNRIRWGNLLTLPVAQGGLLYVEPVYASPGASDAASSYPRLIRVAMMYNDKVGYGPTVRDALDELFGPGAGDGDRDRPGRGRDLAARPRRRRSRRASRRPRRRGARAAGPRPRCPMPIVAAAGWRLRCSCRPRKPLRCKRSTPRWTRCAQAQQSGNFAQYGQALQKPRRRHGQVPEREVDVRGRVGDSAREGDAGLSRRHAVGPGALCARSRRSGSRFGVGPLR